MPLGFDYDATIKGWTNEVTHIKNPFMTKNCILWHTLMEDCSLLTIQPYYVK